MFVTPMDIGIATNADTNDNANADNDRVGCAYKLQKTRSDQFWKAYEPRISLHVRLSV